MTKLIVIVGPTSSGKTSLSFEIASRYNGEIINSDSMQVYRWMDIGTSKPKREMMEKVIHHLFSVFDPSFNMNAGFYANVAKNCIKDIVDRGKIPVITGGTGLYIRALIDGLSQIPLVSMETKEKVKRLLKEKKLEFLYERLKNVDPESARKLKPRDTQRIMRALEVYYECGKPICYFYEKEKRREKLYNPLIIGIIAPREELYKRIEERVEKMIEEGLLEEVKNLYKLGFSAELKSMRGLGYREVGKYLRGEWGYEEMIEELKKEHRRYAKRQITWFKNDHRINWFHPQEKDKIFNVVEDFLKKD